MPTVTINNLTVVHRASGGVSMAFPDPCKTPTPPGPPVPIPYPNVAMSTHTAEGSASVKMEGEPIMLKSSNFTQSTGDEAGSALGVVSGKTRGKAYPKLYSFDVKVDGENVFRQSDIMLQNGGSPTNTPPGTEVQPGLPPTVPPAPANMSHPERPPSVRKIEFTPRRCCCGDVVTVELETVNHVDQEPLFMQNESSTGEAPYPRVVAVEVNGDKASASWAVRRGPYRKDVFWRLDALDIAGDVQSNDLEIQAAPAAMESIIGEHRSPRWLANDAGVLVHKSGDDYHGQYAFTIAIRAGELVVTRRVDFVGESWLLGLWYEEPPVVSETTKRAWKSEIEGVWDKKFKLHRARCARGDGCDCDSSNGCCTWSVRVRCEFAPADEDVEPVRLHPGANDPRGWGTPRWWYSHDWWEIARGVPASVRAHEFGHLIGMYDEYPKGACDPGRRYTDEPSSVMGGGAQVHERHFETFREWFEKVAARVVGPARLIRL